MFGMNLVAHRAWKPALLIALPALALAGTLGLTFAGWVEHGAGIFMAMAESGLSWCF